MGSAERLSPRLPRARPAARGSSHRNPRARPVSRQRPSTGFKRHQTEIPLMITFHQSNRLASLLAGLATTALASTAVAQGATITGTVKSSLGHALHAANVRIPTLNVSYGTREDGTYRIVLAPDRVRGQTVTLTVRAIGHKPQSKEITIGAGAQDHDFTLDVDA